uniref:radical SAM family heme chaperone HemW n=1 Tax=Aquimarina agarilytica TaxID=1087449 RepID=UPI00293483A6|nr:radical SAM family heme chaperone HemW [Aquimarina agarilytica]
MPFCKKACHYCDFHFSTSFKKKEAIIAALCSEIKLRKHELNDDRIQTIYFGGGTPSVCSTSEINQIIETIYTHYNVSKNPEITLEANPDDLSEEKITDLASTKINRLSIGVQSFFEEDLQLMNRAHNAQEALNCLQIAKKQFTNISIDLIYGIPGMSSNERWKKNLEITIALGLPHISSYALTVEKNTALEKLIKKGTIAPVNDATAEAHYQILTATLEKEGYTNYEFSNFGKPNYFSQNNTAYWQGKKYIGIGPSAHSFDGIHRSWNIANNTLYIKGIQSNKRNFETETLTSTDRFNEYIMTGLRTIWGISLLKIATDFGQHYLKHLKNQSQAHLKNGLLEIKNEHLHITKKGKFLGDGIASDLFFLN